jgi:hypothetical protein
MSHPVKLGWACFALCCLILAVYALNRGIYVGARRDARGDIFDCRYLYASGVVVRNPESTLDECRLFYSK